MNRVSRAGVVAVALAIAGAFLINRPIRSLGAPPESVAVDRIKSDAFDALRAGRFDETNEMLSRAAKASHDPTLERLAVWTSDFEQQRKEFASERDEEYRKALGNVHLLLDNHHADYAIDAAARAYPLSSDKSQFRKEQGLDDLIKGSIIRAADYEKSDQWIKSLRIYSDLSQLEPSIPLWKDKLKLATRRVTLLALYAPDTLKTLQDGDQKERDEVEALLRPTTQATTKPAKAAATQPAADDDNFKVDWHDTLRGVTMDMLRVALEDTRTNYYRDVNYKKLAIGGLGGVEAIATTPGLEKAFPGLADAGQKSEFIATINAEIAANNKAGEDDERITLLTTLMKIKSVNKQTVKIPEEVLVNEFASGAFAECDPFTNMIWPSEVAEFNKSTSGEFSGVGIQIQNDPAGNLKVVQPLEDTPAYKAGIKPDDIITHINDKSAKNISINQAVKNITGPPGTIVKLTVKSTDGRVVEYNLKRETIHVASVKGWEPRQGGGWKYMVDEENKIAYMRLTSFTKDSPREMEHAIEQITAGGGRGIILDLRYNPGGLLTSAIDIADQYLKEGVIVSTHPDRDTGNPPTKAFAKPGNETDLPLIVLVNQYSASASEIVSGALKDQHRALIVGERTFGKGSVQMLFPLADHAAYLKLTTSHYYLPSGRCIHREENSEEWGVAPDVTIEMTPEQTGVAIVARQEQDILRDPNAMPADKKVIAKPIDDKEKKPKKSLRSSDAQLSGAVLLMKLQLAAKAHG